MGFFRSIFISIDKVVFNLIDTAYNLIFSVAGSTLNSDVLKVIMKNLYIVVGIFAFFRIALILVNALIDPEKLNEKGKGLGNILVRTVIMLVLLLFTPMLFDMAYDLQGDIVGKAGEPDSGHIIEKLILGEAAIGDTSGDATPGDQFKSTALAALIPVDKNFTEGELQVPSEDNDWFGGYNSKCNSNECTSAIQNWNEMYVNGKMDIDRLSNYISTYEKVDTGTGKNEKVYVYNYNIFLTTFVGGFIVYVLFSFALDIGMRVFQLAALEIISPIFIVTFVDPKSSSSGMFSRWLKEVGSTYVNLFVRIACVSLLLLFTSIINTIKIVELGNNSSWIKLTLLLGLLLFAKKAPKWISDMLGIKSEGMGLGIGKKLASMAMIGGGIEAARKAIGNGAKKLGKNQLEKGKKKIGNAIDRQIGKSAARKTAKNAFNRANPSNGSYFSNDTAARARERARRKAANAAGKEAAEARAADIMRNQAADPSNDFRWFKGTRNKYAESAMAVDPTYRSGKQQKLDKLNADADLKLTKAGMDAKSMGIKQKLAADLAKARAIYGNRPDSEFLDSNGKFNKAAFPLNDTGMNNVYSGVYRDNNGPRNAMTEDEMYIAKWVTEGRKNGLSRNVEYSDDGKISITDENGRSRDLKELVSEIKKSMTGHGQAVAAEVTFKNQINYQNAYQENYKLRNEETANLAQLTANLNDFLKQKLTSEEMLELSRLDMKERMEQLELKLSSDDFENYTSFNDAVERSKAKIASIGKDISAAEDYYIKMSNNYSNPDDDPSTININGRFINKVGEYEQQSDGSYKFVVKDMSSFNDVITKELNDSLKKKFTDKVEASKPTELKQAEKEGKA